MGLANLTPIQSQGVEDLFGLLEWRQLQSLAHTVSRGKVRVQTSRRAVQRSSPNTSKKYCLSFFWTFHDGRQLNMYMRYRTTRTYHRLCNMINENY